MIPTHCVCWAVRMTAWAQIWRLHFGFVAFLSTCILYSLQQSVSFVQKFWGNAKNIFFSSSSSFFLFLYFFLILHIEQLQHCTQPRIITEQWGATKVVFTQENEVARMQTRTRSWQLNNSGYGDSRFKKPMNTSFFDTDTFQNTSKFNAVICNSNYHKQIIIWYFLYLKNPLNKEYPVYEDCQSILNYTYRCTYI